ncbi:Site-specific recombinase XerD [Bosea lupini]|uniref:Site-specific recombinase XerD n=1 Tax=Bosea lupini TaxID=1036779 RepID=A0A1H7PWL1_9HYPH|nr:site-specific integrase [Bosea lupini]SEL39774.1 Site-specific recombinase XerD [Bosea lupini]
MAKRLTDAAVKAAKPDPAKRIEVADAGAAGLHLVIQPAPSGKKSWAYRYRLHGKTAKLTIGPYPAFSLTEAREKAQEFDRLRQRGEDPGLGEKRRKRALKEAHVADAGTFAGEARRYLDEYAKSHQRQWRETARMLGLRVDPAKPEDRDNPLAFVTIPKGAADEWSGRLISSITTDDVRDFIHGIRRRGAPIAANRTLAALKGCFSWLKANTARLPVDPSASVSKPQKETARDRVLSHDEIRILWKACDELGELFGASIKLMLLTAQRRDEVGGLRRPELSRDGLMWTLPGERAKNGKEHEIPLAPTVREILAALPKVDSKAKLIFTTTGETPISGWSKAKAKLDEEMLKLLRKEAAQRGENPASVELPSFTLHDLRRTADTLMNDELEVAPHVVEAILNHVRKGDERRYNHAKLREPKRRALEAWAAHVAWIVADKPETDVVVPMRALG